MDFTVTHSINLTLQFPHEITLKLVFTHNDTGVLLETLEKLSKYESQSDPIRLLPIYLKVSEIKGVDFKVNFVGDWYNWRLVLLKWAFKLWNRLARNKKLEEIIKEWGIVVND